MASIRRSVRFTEAKELARKFGLEYDDLDRAIKEGILDAHRTLDGTDWLVDESDLQWFIHSNKGVGVKDAIAQAIAHRRVEDYPGFTLSQSLLAIASAIFFLAFAAGIIIIVVSIARLNVFVGFIGFLMVVISAGYLVFYDLLRAVFSMHSVLVKILALMESMDVAARRSDHPDK